MKYQTVIFSASIIFESKSYARRLCQSRASHVYKGLENPTQSIVNNLLTATKITSDNCVPAGNPTFKATLPSLVAVGMNLPIEFTTGNVGTPACCQTPATLTILKPKLFSAYGVTFKKAP